MAWSEHARCWLSVPRKATARHPGPQPRNDLAIALLPTTTARIMEVMDEVRRRSESTSPEV